MQIRPASPADLDFVLGIVPRFVDFGPPAGRDPDALAAAFARDLTAAITGAGAVFIAEEDGEPLGFIHLHGRPDLDGSERGHVSDLAVAASAEGRGVARALLARAEEWARDAGYSRLGLSALVTNERAIRLYEHVGFERETVTLTKPL